MRSSKSLSETRESSLSSATIGALTGLSAAAGLTTVASVAAEAAGAERFADSYVLTPVATTVT